MAFKKLNDTAANDRATEKAYEQMDWARGMAEEAQEAQRQMLAAATRIANALEKIAAHIVNHDTFFVTNRPSQ